ncbi:cyclic nucleotide-binding domain-containing protein [Paucibacter sp. TC2R-5]|uniref:SulP family inorganic anion transporter n=1 Tax=Paucibacter sp. TC2R-5 TaxID=2893555 RepID=UPI0021E402E2|nr:SulP family inorganic anion transporter [Paucibacter sp. TC2R-5]MCV2359320.1 cyclic nucleotide-binding domain-containing protein [Paucibacter sp. TC2R-5]
MTSPIATPSHRLASVLASLHALLGGAVGAVVSLAIVLTLGVLALAPMGSRAALIGVPAAFACVIVGAGIFSICSRSRMAAGGPSSPTALIIAFLLSQVLRQEQASGGALALTLVLAVLSAAVMVMGLLQMLMAAMKLGRLARFVPQPVLAGFMNGVALLVLLAQVPALLAVAPELWPGQGWRALQQAHGGALALGLGTAGLVWLLAWRAPRWPAALAGMLLGLLGFHLASATWPALDLGATLGALEAEQFLSGLFAVWAEPVATLSLLAPHARAIGLTAILLAMVGSLESLLNLRAADQRSGEQSDENRELWALGLANIGGGLFCALPVTRSRSRAMAIEMAGGRGGLGAIGAVLCSALLVGFAGDCLAYLPRAVLAGVMLTVAFSLVDRRSIQQLLQQLLQQLGRPNSPHSPSNSDGRARREGLLTMSLVCLLTLWQGPGAGVILGLLLSILLFLRGLNRSLVRARFSAQQRPSRRVYPPQVELALREARPHILVVEWEGALFFGNADRVQDEARHVPADARCLIVDLQRVLSIDESGAMALLQLHAALARRACRLLLAGLGPNSPLRSQLMDHLPEAKSATSGLISNQCHLDVDHALEAAERQALQKCLGSGQVHELGGAVPLAQSSLLRDLSAAQQTVATVYLQPLSLKAGERLFSEGELGNGVYVLTRGSISIVSGSGQRFMSFSAGTMLGELALLDGQGRSADAVADQDAELFLLTSQALSAMAAADPLLCSQLYRNMALHLATRLRVATSAWRSAAGLQ